MTKRSQWVLYWFSLFSLVFAVALPFTETLRGFVIPMIILQMAVLAYLIGVLIKKKKLRLMGGISLFNTVFATATTFIVL